MHQQQSLISPNQHVLLVDHQKRANGMLQLETPLSHQLIGLQHVGFLLDGRHRNLAANLLLQHYVFEVLILIHLLHLALTVQLPPHKCAIHQLFESGSVLFLNPQHFFKQTAEVLGAAAALRLPVVEAEF